jgi:hypothetical protein
LKKRVKGNHPILDIRDSVATLEKLHDTKWKRVEDWRENDSYLRWKRRCNIHITVIPEEDNKYSEEIL